MGCTSRVRFCYIVGYSQFTNFFSRITSATSPSLLSTVHSSFPSPFTLCCIISLYILNVIVPDMTVAALSYLPAQHSNSTTTAAASGASRWRKGLAVFSRWHQQHYPSSRRWSHSPTTLAAATEKVICHTKKQDIKCEDLTAQEFAQMTGIKIKEADLLMEEEASVEEDHWLTTQSARSTDRLSIWDSSFWHHGDPHGCSNSSTATTRSCSNTHPRLFALRRHQYTNTSTTSSDLPSPPSLLSHSSSASSAQSSCCSRGAGVITKGRFKIVVGQTEENYDETESLQTAADVVEWKRKRT
ncbi:hypothetical protein BCR43DRAFT_494266 [Syncephalastrum racemosum]|uniref:Uncharacterized protein n=1 Tax=Syncephalastrum racemosum TaxID=13706 RepID=A0A1X2H7V5_SYNRA|nr:hypothetical protein BCR43DRAFT_494266 [Syncephalastrum racemosum]